MVDEDKSNIYYFVVYVKGMPGSYSFCNDTIKGSPVMWVMHKCNKSPESLYNLIFYKEITLDEYIIFHPEELGKDLEKVPEELTKKFGSRLSIPKEDDELGSFTGYSDIL